MSEFLRQLKDVNPTAENRRWIYVPYDQLSHEIGPLAETPPEECGIVLVETTWKPGRRRYHKQKLSLILANQRHFALEQARRGVAVRYVFAKHSYAEALRGIIDELGPLTMMRAAERELRIDLEDLAEAGDLEVVEHQGWLTTEDQFQAARGKDGRYRMDRFYRRVRQDTGLLMEDGSPVGGKYSHDAENRESWSGSPEAPSPPTFERDAIKDEVGELVEDLFSDHPGRLDLDALPATIEDAERLWAWAKDECSEFFGPYEDAMSTQSRGLFHTRISALLNLHRLLPERIVEEWLQLDTPIESREGFVRQILGWREFVRWIHEQTDGFRELPEQDVECSGDGSAMPNFLEANQALPPAFWGDASGLRCLDEVVTEVWEDGYSHHITRLMVLSNIATLLDVSPRELTDWFWVAYVDAYDWVVEPNVLGMGTFALGDLMTTKPYVSGANYIDKMSDYCADCAFDPKKTCPLTSLYWQFLARHRDRLGDNNRLRLMLSSVDKRAAGKKQHDREVFEWATDRLQAGEALTPQAMPAAAK